MERITPEFARTDAVVVVGANDVVNPAATTQPDSPLHGMPVLPAWEADSVFVIKRSLAPGFAGIKNELFERSNTMMLYGDAKEVLRDLTSELREATGV
jgi:NAD(P) transhydrogenase subunit beta